jgi:hypothetical protein
LEKRAKAAAVMKKATKAMKRNCEARKTHADCVAAGRLVDKDGNLRLNKQDSHAIVMFLLPRLGIKGESKATALEVLGGADLEIRPKVVKPLPSHGKLA